MKENTFHSQVWSQKRAVQVYKQHTSLKSAFLPHSSQAVHRLVFKCQDGSLILDTTGEVHSCCVGQARHAEGQIYKVPLTPKLYPFLLHLSLQWGHMSPTGNHWLPRLICCC